MKFSVGDRVQYIGDSLDAAPGECGTVVVVQGESVGVAFDQPRQGRHSLGGECENEYGWWLWERDLEFEEEDVPEDSSLPGLADFL